MSVVGNGVGRRPGESAFAYNLRRRRALRAAAIVEVGWGRDDGDNKLDPQEHWDWREANLPASANEAALAIATEIVEAFEAEMAGSGTEGEA